MENFERPSCEDLVSEAEEIANAIKAALDSSGTMMKGCSMRSEVVKRREIAYELELLGTEEALVVAKEIRGLNRKFILAMEQH